MSQFRWDKETRLSMPNKGKGKKGGSSSGPAKASKSVSKAQAPSSSASQILPAQPQHPSANSQTTPFIKGAQIQETSAHSSRTMKMMMMLLISALIASGVAFAPLPPARDRDDTCPCADPNPCFHESIGDGSCVPLEEAYAAC